MAAIWNRLIAILPGSRCWPPLAADIEKNAPAEADAIFLQKKRTAGFDILIKYVMRDPAISGALIPEV